MKNILAAFFIMFTGVLIGQSETGTLKGLKILDWEKYKKEDTIPKVVYIKDNLINKEPVVYVNGEKYELQLFNTINNDLIENLEMEKLMSFDDDKTYRGSIFINLKNDYKPKLISLNQLKSKYVKEIFNPTLFIVNEKPINSDYDQYMVDEKFIMKIEVEEVINDNEGLYLTIIKLITRSDENLKKANIIYLRGDKQNE